MRQVARFGLSRNCHIAAEPPPHRSVKVGPNGTTGCRRRCQCRTARHRGGVLCLVAPSRYVLTVLHTMHVDGVFPTFADGVAAFSWLRRGDLARVPALDQAVAAAGD
jgi:hypothetical protein